MPTSDWSTMVLSGGRSSRLGFDKSRATVAGVTLFVHVLGSVPADVPCIVVGPSPGRTPRPVTIAAEPEPDGGPVSGISCGLAHVATPIVVIVAVDMPFVGPLLADLVTTLRSSPEGIDAVMPIDGSGRRQPLAAAYRTHALRAALTRLGPPVGRSMRDLLAPLAIIESPIAAEADALLDVDNADDLAVARRSVSLGRTPTTKGTTTMSEWTEAAALSLGIDHDFDIDEILDVAREVAHGVERPAAPVTTFLMGYAVAKGYSASEAAVRLTALAREWPKAE